MVAFFINDIIKLHRCDTFIQTSEQIGENVTDCKYNHSYSAMAFIQDDLPLHVWYQQQNIIFSDRSPWYFFLYSADNRIYGRCV